MTILLVVLCLPPRQQRYYEAHPTPFHDRGRVSHAVNMCELLRKDGDRELLCSKVFVRIVLCDCPVVLVLVKIIHRTASSVESVCWPSCVTAFGHCKKISLAELGFVYHDPSCVGLAHIYTHICPMRNSHQLYINKSCSSS